jgi:queuosine precursor transporter
MDSNHINSNKKQNLFIILSTLFLTNALIAEVIGAKIFSFEKIFHLQSMALPFFGGESLSLNVSVGVIIWPIVFILSDIINEYFGTSGVKRISYIGAGMIGYAFILVYLAMRTPPADFWLQNNSVDPDGHPFNINYAYNAIFRQGMGIIVGSIIAFLVGQLVDAYVFKYIRSITQHKYLWLRATGSTVVSQLVDSFLILFIAFYLLGNWTLVQVVSVGLIQYIYKIALAVIFTPVIYWMHILIDRYLGKDKSAEMQDIAQTL